MKQTPRWPVVLFDLDGTLVNTIEAIVASYTYTWASVGREVSRQQILGWIGRTLRDVFTEEAPERADELEQRYIAHNIASHADLVREYPGIPSLLLDLDAAGIRTGIVTAKRRANAVLSMSHGKVPDTITLACAMEDTPSHKPEPEPLLLGLASFGAEPKDAVYVGDAVYDLQAAAAAGMAGIGVTWGAGAREELTAQPHISIIDEVSQLRALLLG